MYFYYSRCPRFQLLYHWLRPLCPLSPLFPLQLKFITTGLCFYGLVFLILSSRALLVKFTCHSFTGMRDMILELVYLVGQNFNYHIIIIWSEYYPIDKMSLKNKIFVIHWKTRLHEFIQIHRGKIWSTIETYFMHHIHIKYDYLRRNR